MHMIEQFDVRVRRLALLGPVGIDEGETVSDRLELLLGGAKFMPDIDVVPQACSSAAGWRTGGRVRARGQEPAGRRADC
jgi:predicted methyltransferase MtxX (methanogen marker protein 4)